MMNPTHTHKRRAVLKAAALAMLMPGGCALRPLHANRPRPNIVLIFGDDLGPELGCYGYPGVSTPRLDQLAAQGIRYTQAFTTAPVCSASRSCLFTGRYQTSIGAHHHRSNRDRPLPADVPLLTDVLRCAGYHCSLVHDAGLGAIAKTDWNFKPQREPFDGNDWRQRGADQPFFAVVNIFEPHRPFAPPVDAPVDPDRVTLPPYYPDHPLARREWAAYLDAINRLDHKVGAVVDRLEGDGLADNTAIIFMGDNGRPFPRAKQFLYDGGIHVPLLLRQPGRRGGGRVDHTLISGIDLMPTVLGLAGVAPPPGLPGRDLTDPLASPPECIFAARDRCDETVDRIRCVRSRRWKYLRNFYPGRSWTQPNAYKDENYPILGLMREMHDAGRLKPQQARFMAPTRPPEELYDLETDPHELNNLAGEPAMQDRLAEMRGQLDRWIIETGDMGAQPEQTEEDTTMSANTAFRPGQVWLDTTGEPIQAHGGGVLFHGGVYYWYGEDKSNPTYQWERPNGNIDRVDVRGVAGYRSRNLIDWEPLGLVLAADPTGAQPDLHPSRVVERPKVIFNAPTGKFVMWMHVDAPDYSEGKLGVAVADAPGGPFHYVRSMKPNGHDAHDMTAYVDDDGSGWLIFGAGWHEAIQVARLDETFTRPTGEFANVLERPGPPTGREAPAIFKRRGRYYMITSGTTGWAPNPAELAVADRLLGPWETLGNPVRGKGSETTFNAQSTFVLTVQGMDDAFIFMADRWDPANLGDSRYVWLPIDFDGEMPVIKWRDEWTLDVFAR